MIPAEQNYEVYDQELLAIVMAFEYWRHYLSGNVYPIEVLTDHNNLRGFIGVKQLTAYQARWALKLAAYDFTIVHRPGKTNPADAPSRRPDYEGESIELTQLLPTLQNKLALWTDQTQSLSIRGDSGLVGLVLEEAGCNLLSSRRTVNAVSESAFGERSPEVVDLIKTLQQRDAFVARWRSDGGKTSRRIRKGESAVWKFDDGVLTYSGRYYVPGDEALRQELLSRYHDDIFAGHFGAAKTLELLERKYYWDRMRTDVRAYIKSCDVCQRTKVLRHRPYGELHSLPQPKGPWKEIAMDFITDLPLSKRRGTVYDAILVVIDRYTKMVIYIPTQKTVNAPELADLFLDVIGRVGAPDGIVSDRGSLFTSSFWSAICYHMAIKRKLLTAFHPQTDGITERHNQVLEQYLRIYCNEEQNNWAGLLPMAEFAYHNSFHKSLGMTPFMAMYGYNPEIRFEGEALEEGNVPTAKERVQKLHEIRAKLADTYRSAVADQQKYFNAKHKPKGFQVGSLVMLSAKNLKQKRPSRKLSHKFIGPFKVLDAVGAQAYRLALPSNYRIHNVFHVTLLEPYDRSRHNDDGFMPPPELIDDEEQWEVEEVLARRRRQGVVQYKVKWQGFGDEYNEWIPVGDMDNVKELREDFESRSEKRRRFY